MVICKRNSSPWLVLFIFFGCFFNATVMSPAHAENCNAPQEAINNLFSPRLGTYSLWDLVNGVPDMRQSFTGFIMENETDVILAGYQKNNKLRRPIIRKMNRRGRVLWTWMDKNQMGLSRPIMIEELINEGKTFLAIGQFYKNNAAHGIWLARFDKSGKKLSDKIISVPGRNYTYGGITKALNKKDWLLAVNEKRASNTQELNPSNSRFLLLNKNFNIKLNRAFLPGPENKVHALTKVMNPVSGNFYIAAGEIDDGYNRKAGMVLRLNEDANIAWQRSYPRGNGLRFQDAATSADGQIIVTGEAQPINEEGRLAGIAAKLSSDNGMEIWQRYFMREDISYSGISLATSSDGRSHILLKGTDIQNEELQNHARIFTLSPRGETMNEINYTTGTSAMPETLKVWTDSSLLLSGMATINVPDPSDPENKTKLSDQGWFVVGDKIGSYTDPCIKKEQPF